MPVLADLRSSIEYHAAQPAADLDRVAAREAFDALLLALESGAARSAERGDDGIWRANTWVKQGILLGFRLGGIVDFSSGVFSFFDKETFPARQIQASDGVRVVPGGSTVRRGAYRPSTPDLGLISRVSTRSP